MTTKPIPQPRGAGGRAGMKKELPEHFRCYKHVWVFIDSNVASSIPSRGN